LHALFSHIWAAGALLLLFGVTIFVHEFGHYLAARLTGMVVDVFSIGFGPAIWKRRYRDTVYKIGSIPFGGYVSLPQLDPTAMRAVQGTDGPEQTEQNGGKQRVLPAVAAWKKMVVALSGSAGNLLLALVTAWLVYWVGVPAGPAERSTVVGYVDEHSAAYARGLRIGDEILRVNGTRVHKWSEFRMESALSREVTLDVRSPDGILKTIHVPTEKGPLGEMAVAGVDGRDLCSVLSVEPGMTAAEAGIRPGDIIIEFAGQEVFSRAHLIDLVARHRDQTVGVKIKRPTEKGRFEVVTTTVTPRLDKETGKVRIGIQFNLMAVEYDTVARPRPSEQMRSHLASTLRFLRALITPREARAASHAVGGPVAIAASYWFIVKASIMLAISFTGLLNVNLAVLNLLPIPVLDGGHILFALWELVTRRPVNAKVVNGLVSAFAALLIVLMGLLSVRDLGRFTPASRLLSKWRGEATNALAAGGGETSNAAETDTASAGSTNR